MGTGYIIIAAVSMILLLFVFTSLRPIAGFFLLLTFRIAFDALSTHTLGSRGLSVSGVFGVFIVAYALAVVPFTKESRFFPPVIRMYYVFLVCTLPSAMADPNLMGFVTQWMKLLSMACLYLIAYNLVHDEKDVHAALKGFVLASVPSMLYGFWQLATSQGYVTYVQNDVFFRKINATFTHPNQYGFYLALVFFALFALFQKKQWHPLLTLYLLAGNLISILFTYSRSVWLTLAACILFLVALSKRRRIPVFILLSVLLIGFSPLIARRFADILDTNGNTFNSLQFRINMTRQLFEGFAKSPAIGFGLGSSLKAATLFTAYDTAPHNDYMRVLIETGLCGFTGFLLFIASCLAYTFRRIQHLADNVYFKCSTVISIFFLVIIVGTNHLGNVSTGGMWFVLLAILHKGFFLSTRPEPAGET